MPQKHQLHSYSWCFSNPLDVCWREWFHDAQTCPNLQSIYIWRFGNFSVWRVLAHEDDCKLLTSTKEVVDIAITLGSAGQAVWLGYYPKNGNLEKLWGCHLISFTRKAAHEWFRYVKQNVVNEEVGFDTWMRRFLREKKLIRLAEESIAVQRGHTLKGRQ
jgi:hypothetical protein